MEKILVTGANGFVGENLVSRLCQDKNFEVHGIDEKPGDAEGRAVIHRVDLTEYQNVSNLVKQLQPDYVIHLAALTSVSYSYDHYIEVANANYTATVNLAESCHREAPNLKQFIFTGSTEEHGVALSDRSKKLTEESEFRPNSPYAVSKVAAELYLKYMDAAYSFPYTVLRAVNTYGRKRSASFFIERTVTQMLAHGDVMLGDPDVVRDWLYIDDHVNAYIKALGNRNALRQAIIISTGKGYSTRETAELAARLTSFRGTIKWNTIPHRPLDAKVIIGDNSKAKRLLGWEPQYSLEEGLKKTIEYWKAKR